MIQLRRCHTCHLPGVGPVRAKLYTFEDRLYCATHFKAVLTWHESRGNVVRGLRSEYENRVEIERNLRRGETLAQRVQGAMTAEERRDWRGYLVECCELAAWAFEHDSRRTFVYYAARAVYAWALKEGR